MGSVGYTQYMGSVGYTQYMGSVGYTQHTGSVQRQVRGELVTQLHSGFF